MNDWLCRAYHVLHRVAFFGGGLVLPMVDLVRRPLTDDERDLCWGGEVLRYDFTCKRCGVQWSLDV